MCVCACQGHRDARAQPPPPTAMPDAPEPRVCHVPSVVSSSSAQCACTTVARQGHRTEDADSSGDAAGTAPVPSAGLRTSPPRFAAAGSRVPARQGAARAPLLPHFALDANGRPLAHPQPRRAVAASRDAAPRLIGSERHGGADFLARPRAAPQLWRLADARPAEAIIAPLPHHAAPAPFFFPCGLFCANV